VLLSAGGLSLSKPAQTLIQKIRNRHFPDWVYPIFLLFLCVFAYGILIPWLGFYSDDWFLVWINFKLGHQGILDLYNLTRPLLSAVPQVIIPLFKFTPWLFQVFALLMRWCAGFVMWLLLRRLWPQRREIATWASALFVLYPAFTLQSMALTTGNLLVYLVVLFLSFFFTVKAVQSPTRFWIFSILAVVLSAINLLFLDYFFMIELVRPILIWVAMDSSLSSARSKIWKTFKFWLPYLMLFLLVGIFRAFFFQQQTNLRNVVLLEQLRSNFGLGILSLIKGLIQYIYVNAIQSWIATFRTSFQTNIGFSSFIVFWILVTGTLVLSFVLFLFAQHEPSTKTTAKKSPIIALLWITGVTFIFAGLPFLTIGQASALTGFSSRFNLAYMFGISLMVAAIIEMIPLKRIWKVAIISILIAFSLGWQFRATTVFRLDWKAQERFFWQLTWRIPNLEPGTLIITDDIPQLGYNGATAVTSAVDYIYTRSSPTDQLNYDLIYGSEHPGLLDTPKPVIPQWPNYEFPVVSTKIVFISYSNNCPQVLTSEYPFEFPGLSSKFEPFIERSSTVPILSSGDIQMDTALFGKEPTHDWCYYFSKADLARQQGNWDEVVALENQALGLFGFPSSSPRQLFPLIEGLALQGQWSQVQDLLIQTFQFEENRLISAGIASTLRENLSSLKDTYTEFWQYLDTHSSSNEGKASAQSAISTALQEP
jgi:hypothetical protein